MLSTVVITSSLQREHREFVPLSTSMEEKLATSSMMLPHLLVRLYISLLKDTEDEGYCTSIDDRFFPLGTAQLAGNPSANNFYYEKTCLPGVSAHEACTYR